jgi:predicted phosphodiesterase
MLRWVVLSDIHGNRWALDAVLADLERQPPDGYVILGDLVADGPDPTGTLARLRDLPNATFVRGNTDRYLADLSAVEDPGSELSDLIATWQWAADGLGDEGRAFLACLPTDACLQTLAGPVLATHGQPGHDERWIEPQAAEDIETLEWQGARVMLVGHTHIPFALCAEQGTVLNPGSVGLSPQTHWRASYARLDLFAGGQVAVQHCQVEWDVAAYLAAFEGSIPLNQRSAPMLDTLRQLIRK